MNNKVRERTKGSISIFLVIILVPMIALSGLIVDGSRVELAKGMVSSAGDLTMNAALANYDTVLKDVYGLFAMSQNEEALQKNLEKYFSDTLIANGIVGSADEIKNNALLKDISAAFSGGTSDLLKMELVDETFKATKVTGSGLASPQILKNQLVEFMKYRTPINGGLSFFDALSSFSKIAKQADVTKNKVKVDEAAEDFNKKCEQLYKALNTYNDKITSIKEPDWRNDINYYSGNYKEINRTIVLLMSDIPDAKVFIVKNINLEKENKYPFLIEGSFNPTITENSFADLQSKLNTLLNEYKAASFGQNVVKKLSDLQKKPSLSIQEKVQYQIVYDAFINKVALIQKVYEKYISIYDESKDSNSDYVKMQEVIDKIMREEAERISILAKSNKTAITEAKSSATASLIVISKHVVLRIETIDKTLVLLATAQGKISDVKTAASDVTTKNDTLKDSINQYDSGGTSDAFSDGMGQEAKYNEKSFDVSTISELEKQLSAHKDFLTKLRTIYTSVKYADKPIKDITSFDTAKNALSAKKDASGTTYKSKIKAKFDNSPLSVNNVYADGIFEENGVFYAPPYPIHTPPTSYFKNIESCTFWNYLKNAFGTPKTVVDNNAEATQKELTDQGTKDSEAMDKTNKTSSVGANTFSGLPSQTPLDQTAKNGKLEMDGNKGFASMLENMGNTVSNLFTGFGNAMKAGRDNLYVSDYAFNMFSYNTQTVEHALGKNKDKPVTTLTGFNINETNNAMYGAEIEYIVYGLNTPAENVKKTKGNIFAIRFIVNAGYALTNSEIRSITLPPALSIQALTGGLVPYKLPQIVMQLALALAESSIDLEIMSTGAKVAIIKSSDTWVLSPTGGINIAKELAKELAKKGAENLIKITEDKISGAFNKLVDAAGEKVEVKTTDLINDVTVAANAKATEAVGLIFNMFSEKVVISLDQVLLLGKDTSKSAEQIANQIINDSLSDIQTYINSKPDGVVKNIMLSYFNTKIKKIATQIKVDIQNAVEKIDTVSAGDLILKAQDIVAKKIADELNGLAKNINIDISETIKEFQKQIKTGANDYIDMSADEAVAVTNNFLDKTFYKFSESMPQMASNQGGKNSSISSMLVFGYSDYLKMFMFLKLCANDDVVLLRLADVIQINICNGLKDTNPVYTHKKGNKFRMSEAKTYIQIDAEVRLKTMFLSLPIVTNYTDKSGSYFKIKYKSTLGY